MQGLFITGTDTGVGKTAVLGALLCALRRAGRDAVPMKPVQTGGRRGRKGLTSPDLTLALAAAGLSPDASERRLMCPYLFAPACSPHLAAAQAGRVIRIAAILKAFHRLKTAHEIVLVEGAGGILVPLNRRETMLDLMKALALPVVVAARPGLGTLNHTLLTLRELRRQGLRVLGVILVCTRPGRRGWIEQSNLETIRRLGKTPVHYMGHLPALSHRNRPPERLPTQALREAARWLKLWHVF
ncbi:MAG: dethiobiotin synthase [Verrucomicrobia bacterium]|nr:dethiobiotin synthase [Verrucomicrobiota bacterium]